MSGSAIPVGAQGADAGPVSQSGEQTNTLLPQASHDRQGGGAPGTVKQAFSHRDEADAHPETRDDTRADPNSIEALTGDAPLAQNEPSGKFMASLDAAKEAQESSGTTTI